MRETKERIGDSEEAGIIFYFLMYQAEQTHDAYMKLTDEFNALEKRANLDKNESKKDA